jgi:hypothetical protein
MITDPRKIPPGEMRLPVVQPMRINALQRALLRAGALSLPRKLRTGRR